MTEFDIRLVKANVQVDEQLRIGVLTENGERVAELRCVDRSMMSSPDLVNNMTAWRANAMQFFLSQFSASQERTAQWLENVVLPSADRILFVITGAQSEMIGQIGLCNMSSGVPEVDNIIRGRPATTPGIMFYSVAALLRWTFHELEAYTAQLHVLSTNLPAIKLYHRLGFAESARYPLRQIVEDRGTRYTMEKVGHDAGFDYLRMVLSKDKFNQYLPWIRKPLLQDSLHLDPK